MITRVWVELVCGGCGTMFTADPDRVPCFTTAMGKFGICRPCWDRRNRLRAAGGMPQDGRPACYPGDLEAAG
jgi:hypothetical protein